MQKSSIGQNSPPPPTSGLLNENYALTVELSSLDLVMLLPARLESTLTKSVPHVDMCAPIQLLLNLL